MANRDPETVQLDVTELALEASPKAIKRLIKLVDSKDEWVALAAASAVLDRAIGKPMRQVRVMVTNETRTVQEMTDSELVALINSKIDRIEDLMAASATAPGNRRKPH